MSEQATTQESLDFESVSESAWNEGWGDDPIETEPEETGAEQSEELESTEPDTEADQPEEEGDAGEESDSEETAEDEGEEAEADTQADSYLLKHLGEERTVDREEVISLAQKGLDYDRVKGKWDEVKDEIPKLKGYEAFLKEIAGNGDIETLMDETRARMLMDKAEKEGKKLDPTKAAVEAAKIRMQSQPVEKDTEAEVKARNDAMVQAFIAKFGGKVKASEIPNSVWEEAAKTGDMIAPYQEYLNSQMESRIKALEKELKTAKTAAKNRQQSAGSSRSEGSAATSDPFEEGWKSGL